MFIELLLKDTKTQELPDRDPGWALFYYHQQIDKGTIDKLPSFMCKISLLLVKLVKLQNVFSFYLENKKLPQTGQLFLKHVTLVKMLRNKSHRQ